MSHTPTNMSANSLCKAVKMPLPSPTQIFHYVSDHRKTQALPTSAILIIPSPANITLYGVHTVGVFLPWHRYAIWIFESVLRSECNYTGAQPYWDWTLDNASTGNGSILTSPVLEAFGGNGVEPSGCIQRGPFSGNDSLNIGPVESMAQNPRCLTRAVDVDMFEKGANWDEIYPPTMQAKNYYQLQNFIDGLSFVDEADKIPTSAGINPHGLGHMGVGGDVRIPPLAILYDLSTHLGHFTLTLLS